MDAIKLLFSLRWGHFEINTNLALMYSRLARVKLPRYSEVQIRTHCKSNLAYLSSPTFSYRLSYNNYARTAVIRSLATTKKSTTDATKKKISSTKNTIPQNAIESESRKTVKQKTKPLADEEDDDSWSLKKQLGLKIKDVQKEERPRIDEQEEEEEEQLQVEEEMEDEQEMDVDENIWHASRNERDGEDDPQIDKVWSLLESEFLQQQAQRSQEREEKEKRIQERMETYQPFQPYQRAQWNKPQRPFNSTFSRIDRLDRLEDKVTDRISSDRSDYRQSEYRQERSDRSSERIDYRTPDKSTSERLEYRQYGDKPLERSDREYKQYSERPYERIDRTTERQYAERPTERFTEREYRTEKPTDRYEYSKQYDKGVERSSDRQINRVDRTTDRTDRPERQESTQIEKQIKTEAVQGQIVVPGVTILEQFQQQQQQYQQQVQANIQLMQNNQLLRQQIQLLQQLVNGFQQLLPKNVSEAVDEISKAKQVQHTAAREVVQNMWEQQARLNAQVNELNKAQATAEKQAVTQQATSASQQTQQTATQQQTTPRPQQTISSAQQLHQPQQQQPTVSKTAAQQDHTVQQTPGTHSQQYQYSRQQYVKQQPSSQQQTASSRPAQPAATAHTATVQTRQQTQSDSESVQAPQQAPSRVAARVGTPEQPAQQPQQEAVKATTQQASHQRPPQRTATQQESVKPDSAKPTPQETPKPQPTQQAKSQQESTRPAPSQPQAKAVTQQSQSTQVSQSKTSRQDQATPSSQQTSVKAQEPEKKQPPQHEAPKGTQSAADASTDQSSMTKASTPLPNLTQTPKQTGSQQHSLQQQKPQQQQQFHSRTAPQNQKSQSPSQSQQPQTRPVQQTSPAPAAKQPSRPNDQPAEASTEPAQKAQVGEQSNDAAYSRQHLLNWAQQKAKEASQPIPPSRQELDYIESSFQRLVKKVDPSIELRPVAMAATVDIPSRSKTEASTATEKTQTQAATQQAKKEPTQKASKAEPKPKEQTQQKQPEQKQQEFSKPQTRKDQSQQKSSSTTPHTGKKSYQKNAKMDFDKSSQEKLLSLVEGLHAPQPQSESENLQQVSSWLSNQLKDFRSKENEGRKPVLSTILPSPDNPLRAKTSGTKPSFAETRKTAVAKLINTLDEYEQHKDDPELNIVPPVSQSPTEVDRISHGFLYRTHHHYPDYIEVHSEPLEPASQSSEFKQTRKGPLSGASVAVGAVIRPNVETPGLSSRFRFSLGLTLSVIPSVIPPPRLAHGLEKVLHQPGIHWAKDLYDGSVWNSYLVKIHQPHQINYGVLPKFMQPSTDMTLNKLAVENNCTLTASTSSITQLLTAFHLLYTGYDDLTDFVGGPPAAKRVPRAATYLVLRNQEGGVYAMDKPMSKSSNILTTLGRSLERMLTMEPEEFARKMLKANNPEPLVDTEAYTFMKLDGLLVRSQLDCWDPELPAPLQSFDLKTRATSAIRMDVENYERQSAYKLSKVTGPANSYEKEFRDLVHGRTLLKYYFQVKIGSMAGVFVAYHNTKEIFGFEFISVEEMEKIYFGDHQHAEFEFLSLLNITKNVLSKITSTYPNQDLCILFGLNQHDMDIFVSPCEPGVEDEILITKPAHSWYKLSITPMAKNVPYAIRRNPIGPDVEVKYELSKINQQFEEFKREFEAMKNRTWQY